MSSKSALVFEDNLVCRSLLEDILAEKQYKVTSFVSPALFLPQCAETRCRMGCPCVDVIMTDNEMPGLTGLEFLALLKKYGCIIPSFTVFDSSHNSCNLTKRTGDGFDDTRTIRFR